MLNQRDIETIEGLLEEKLKESFRNYPTKDEFFGSMDTLMGELKAIREEVTVVAGQLADYGDRLECLEEIHPQGKHVSIQ